MITKIEIKEQRSLGWTDEPERSAEGEIDAKMYVRKIHMGEADGQFSKAIAVCVEGLWFVYARKEKVFA